MKASDVREALYSVADPDKVKILSGFFKTGKGGYGEGDVFIGVKVPQNRAIAKEAIDLPLEEVQKLIDDPIHEARVCGFLILVLRFERARKDPAERERIVAFYLENARKANNWDLVDLSAPKILGEWLKDKDRGLLYRLAESDSLWEQRIAIVSTWSIIRGGDLDDTYALARKLMDHPHDLIRKAVGWMLRETGKKDRDRLIGFLEEYATSLSRTSLRYAIEHFPPDMRLRYMTMK